MLTVLKKEIVRRIDPLPLAFLLFLIADDLQTLASLELS